MSIEQDLRIALVAVLSMRFAMSWIYSSPCRERGLFSELRRLPPVVRSSDWIAKAIMLIPLLAYAVDPDVLTRLYTMGGVELGNGQVMHLPNPVRWLMLGVAVIGLLTSFRAWESSVKQPSMVDAASGQEFAVGPFRRSRFPHVFGDGLCFGALALVTNQWLAVAAVVMGILWTRFAYLPAAEQAWRQLLGDGYADYAKRTGWLLPKFQEPKAQYTVPRRFGMSAMIGFTTLCALIFGLLNALQTEFSVPPAVYLFFAAQLFIVSLGQMRFGSTPRSISALVGAILLPTFVYLSAEVPRRGPPLLLIISLSATFGALLGYVMGAIAAGFFMFADWVKPHLPGFRTPTK